MRGDDLMMYMQTIYISSDAVYFLGVLIEMIPIENISDRWERSGSVVEKIRVPLHIFTTMKAKEEFRKPLIDIDLNRAEGCLPSGIHEG